MLEEFEVWLLSQTPHMTEAGEPIQLKRSWKERLFSFPWKPWNATKTIIPQVPSRDVIRLGDGTLVMHPEIALIIKEMTNITNYEDLE